MNFAGYDLAKVLEKETDLLYIGTLLEKLPAHQHYGRPNFEVEGNVITIFLKSKTRKLNLCSITTYKDAVMVFEPDIFYKPVFENEAEYTIELVRPTLRKIAEHIAVDLPLKYFITSIL